MSIGLISTRSLESLLTIQFKPSIHGVIASAAIDLRYVQSGGKFPGDLLRHGATRLFKPAIVKFGWLFNMLTSLIAPTEIRRMSVPSAVT